MRQMNNNARAAGRGLPADSQPKPMLLRSISRALLSRHYRHLAHVMPWQLIGRFGVRHTLQHPAGMTQPEFNAVVTSMAVYASVIATTRNQPSSHSFLLRRHTRGHESGHLGARILTGIGDGLPFLASKTSAVCSERDG